MVCIGPLLAILLMLQYVFRSIEPILLFHWYKTLNNWVCNALKLTLVLKFTLRFHSEAAFVI